MLDNYGRSINYLRISVTDKCNLRCVYCMPEEGVPYKKHKDFLSFESITETVRQGIPLGLTKIRLTGGEPLIKRGICDLVAMIHSLPGLSHLAITSNGVYLAPMAKDLKKAGLDSINVSLDTLDPDRYSRLTRGGDIGDVLGGIEAASAAGIPVKINVVIMEDTAASEIEDLRQFTYSRGMRIQFINHFSIQGRKKNDYSFDRPPACGGCNRIRLLAEGILKPCLHSNHEIKLDLNNIQDSLRKAIEGKPENGEVCDSRNMFEIGG